MAGRAGRPLPGQTQRSGHGLDLGQLLMDIYGGIDANPNASKDPSTLPNDVQGNAGPAVSVKSFNETQQPYFKGRTIFDRQRASIANAEKTYGELQQQQEIANAIKEHEGLGNVDLQLLGKRGPIQATNQGLLNREEETHAGNLANQGLLTQTGQQVTPQNLQMYGEMNTAPAQEATAQSFLGRVINAINANKQSSIQGQIQDTTAQDQINEAKAKSFMGAGMATGDVGNLPRMLMNRRIALANEPTSLNAKIAKEQMIPVHEGESLYNPALGRSVFNVPNKEQQMLNSFNQLKTGQLLNNTTNNPVPSGTAPMGQPVGQQGFKTLDQDTVIIDGQVYKRNGNPSSGFNPYSKF